MCVCVLEAADKIELKKGEKKKEWDFEIVWYSKKLDDHDRVGDDQHVGPIISGGPPNRCSERTVQISSTRRPSLAYFLGQYSWTDKRVHSYLDLVVLGWILQSCWNGQIQLALHFYIMIKWEKHKYCDICKVPVFSDTIGLFLGQYIDI